jgi:D-amino-acid dehydrogenase
MACGSGRLLADLVSGKCPEIDTEGLFMNRYSRSSRPSIVPQQVRV